MIRESEVFYIGTITKARGIKGEVEMRFTDDAFDRGDAEYLVIETDGILVPFFWEEYRFKNQETAILKFEDVDTEARAKTLAGRRVFYPLACLPEDDEQEGLRSWKALTGFKVTDPDGGPLGTIEQVDDSTANILLTLSTPTGREILLPLHEDFVTHLAIKERTIALALPAGLAELNS